MVTVDIDDNAWPVADESHVVRSVRSECCTAQFSDLLVEDGMGIEQDKQSFQNGISL